MTLTTNKHILNSFYFATFQAERVTDISPKKPRSPTVLYVLQKGALRIRTRKKAALRPINSHSELFCRCKCGCLNIKSKAEIYIVKVRCWPRARSRGQLRCVLCRWRLRLRARARALTGSLPVGKISAGSPMMPRAHIRAR